MLTTFTSDLVEQKMLNTTKFFIIYSVRYNST